MDIDLTTLGDVDQYIQLALVIGLMGLGKIIKAFDVFSKIPNNTIPGILIVAGILASIGFNGFSQDSIAVGVISALVSVGLHQFGKTGTSIVTDWVLTKEEKNQTTTQGNNKTE